MTITELATAVATMRRHQREYFRTSSRAKLMIARDAERRVDRLISEVLDRQRRLEFDERPNEAPTPTPNLQSSRSSVPGAFGFAPALRPGH